MYGHTEVLRGQNVTKLMSVFRTKSIEALKNFATHQDQLGIVERKIPAGADAFFQKLMQTPFGIAGKVRNHDAISDIKDILDDQIPSIIQHDPFYERWIEDMAEAAKIFCDIQNSDSIGFWLGSQRGCRRYHIDNVPLRMLITYAGKGTEWLPDEAADRCAFANGEPNEKIIKNPAAIQFMKKWDVAVFRGGAKGLLHRTPDDALNSPSILMRLDHPSFWDNVLKHQKQNGHSPS
jgi:hypothetical protein